MSDLQTFTKSGGKSKTNSGEVNPLPHWQEQYVSFCATGGMITSEDGTIGTMDESGWVAGGKSMTLQEFAAMAGVSRMTLWNWRKTIPNFEERVIAKRKAIGSDYRIQKVWNGLYLKAASGNPQAAAIFLANFDPDFRMPTEKIEHSAGTGLADMIAAKRRTDDSDRKIIDAEISSSNT